MNFDYNVTSNKTQARCQGGAGRLCYAYREPADCEGNKWLGLTPHTNGWLTAWHFIVLTSFTSTSQVIASRGNNLHEAVTAQGESFLVSMPTKFRKNIWIKRGKSQYE